MTAWLASPTPTESTPNLAAWPLSWSFLATWPSGLGNGLQIRVHGFDSHRRLQRSSSVRASDGARYVFGVDRAETALDNYRDRPMRREAGGRGLPQSHSSANMVFRLY